MSGSPVTSSVIGFLGGLRNTVVSRVVLLTTKIGNERQRNEGLCHVLEFTMIGPSTCWMDESSSNARDQELVWDLQLNDVVKLLLPFSEHCVELLSLRNRTRETI